MNNRDTYKSAMSGVHHSNDAVERIFDMTINKKANKGITFKKIASATLALAILIGGGFGANAVVQNSREKQPLSVMVAYADEFTKIQGGTKQTLINGVYFSPADDIQKNKEQLAKAQKDYNEIEAQLGELPKNEPAVGAGIGEFDIYDEDGNVQGKLYTTSAGFFVASKKDYKNVKTLTVENESSDGYLQFEWSGTLETLEKEAEENANGENPYSAFINHKFTLTGEQLRYSQKNFNDYGYSVNWVSTYSVFEAYHVNYTKDYEASQIKDKITFTFEYEDSTTESISADISFDDYGHMQIS